ALDLTGERFASFVYILSVLPEIAVASEQYGPLVEGLGDALVAEDPPLEAVERPPVEAGGEERLLVGGAVGGHELVGDDLVRLEEGEQREVDDRRRQSDRASGSDAFPPVRHVSVEFVRQRLLELLPGGEVELEFEEVSKGPDVVPEAVEVPRAESHLGYAPGH